MLQIESKINVYYSNRDNCSNNNKSKLPSRKRKICEKTKQNRLSDLEMNTVLTAVEREQSAGEANS